MADEETDFVAADGLTQEEFLRSLEGKSLKDLLSDAQRGLLIRLLQSCRDGSASHQELEVLRKLLSDNGMVFGQGFGKSSGVTVGATDGVPTPQMEEPLPDFSDPEYLN